MHYFSTKSKVLIPAIIYGTAWKKERTAELVELAIKNGFRGIDTACQPKHYNEPGVGNGIRRACRDTVSRKDLFIQTKFTPLRGQDPENIPYDSKAPLSEQVRQSVALSLRNLQIKYLDSLILHSPIKPWDALLEVWDTMEALVTEGKVKLLGISNCDNVELLRLIYQTASIKPSIVQNRFYQRTHYDAKIRDYCYQKELVYQGFWTLTANPDLLKSTVLQHISERHNSTVEQVFFRFLTTIGVAPLLGTTSEEHMQEDLNIFSIELTDKERHSIGQLLYPPKSKKQ